MKPILVLDALSKRFGGLAALTDVEFSVQAGRITGLIGPNGAGKTTLFNCIAGLHRPTSGSIHFRSRHGMRPVEGLGPEAMTRLGISRTFQNIRLFGELSALDNIRVGRHPRSTSGYWAALLRTKKQREEERRITREALRLLDFVGLEDKRNALAANLSYGDQRRLEIARALAAEPVLLLLDEPAAGMNPRETEGLVGLLREVTAQAVTVMLIEHDMKLVMRVCEDVVVLDHGVKIAEGAPNEIRSDPTVVDAYLGGGSAFG